MSRILIVEDEQNLAILYKKEFIEDGYDVIIANEGNEAIEKMKRYHPDLIVVDIMLYGMDGITLINKIIEINKDIPIVINSSYSDYLDDFRIGAAKAFVIKSSDVSELKMKVKESLCNWNWPYFKLIKDRINLRM